jgi:predicted transcriptional regulator
MESLTVELDDETVAWLESTATARKKSISEIVEEMIEEIRRASRPMERDPR